MLTNYTKKIQTEACLYLVISGLHKKSGSQPYTLESLVQLLEKYSHTSHSAPRWNSDTGGLGSGLGICILTKLTGTPDGKPGKGTVKLDISYIYVAVTRERKPDSRFCFNKVSEF